MKKAVTWQTIDTAPKDGSPIWAWNPHQPELIRLMCWSRYASMPKQEGWATWSKRGPISYEITHWMPGVRPDPPVPIKGERG